MGGSSAEREISIQTGSAVRARAAGARVRRALARLRRSVRRRAARARARRRLHRAARAGRRGRSRAGAARVSRPFRTRAAASKRRRWRWTSTSRRSCSPPKVLPTPVWDLFDLTGGTLPLLPGSLDLPLVDQAALRGLVGGRLDREDARAVDERDARGVENRTRRFWPKSTSTAASSRARVLGEEALADRRDRRRTATVSTPYDAKYEPGGSTHVVPARDRRRSRRAHADARALGAPPARTARLFAQRLHREPRQAARTFWRSTRCPGLTPTSLVPDACAAVGISFEALVERLVGYARGRADLRDAVA